MVDEWISPRGFPERGHELLDVALCQETVKKETPGQGTDLQSYNPHLDPSAAVENPRGQGMGFTRAHNTTADACK